MRRRLVVANLCVVLVLLVALELPLAVVYSRHEHDALNSALGRDAVAVAAVAGESVAHPDEHDFATLARQFAEPSGTIVTVVGPGGEVLTPPNVVSVDPAFDEVVQAAENGQAGTGEIAGVVYVAAPFQPAGSPVGVALVARSDEEIDQRVHRFWTLLGVLTATVLGLSLVVSLRLSRWVVDPLRRLDRQAAALGRGDLSARSRTTEGPPEMVALVETFNDMANRLDELVNSQRRFVADASHQLRAPLTALTLRIESLRPGDPATMAADREAALDEAARLSRLVDGLLSVARAEGRRPERGAVDVAAVAAERRELWAPLATERGIELGLDVSGPELWASVVEGSLEQILDNLVDNALDASAPGDTIVLGARPAGSTVEVHVVDHGRGMSDEERRRAFDPFWQRAGAAGGTGLGLAIADQQARASHGSITLASAAGGGIDATVCLEVARAPAAYRSAPRSP